MELIENDDSYTLLCEEVMDISSVSAMYSQLLPVVDAGKKIVIDAAGVERCDTAVLQLFVAFIRKMKLNDIAVDAEWSPAVEEAASLIGVKDHLS